MNTRLAQIIALSVGPDGRPDPTRIYDALRMSPDDPLAVIVEGVLMVRAANDEHRVALVEQLQSERGQLREHLLHHAAATELVAQSIATDVEDLRQAREVARQEINSNALKILAAGNTLSEAASAFSARALGSVFLFGLLLGGAIGGGLTFYLTR